MLSIFSLSTRTRVILAKTPLQLAKKIIFLFSSIMPLLTPSMVIASGTTTIATIMTQTGIPLDNEWKQKVYEYAQNNVKHSAWGIAHSERDYQLCITLASNENIKVDTDVIFAAAFLHDIGAIDPFRKKEVEHSIRSIEIVEPLLESYGFPMHKWPKVKAAVLGHMYYSDQPSIAEAIVLHDADILDFIGVIGITRLISVTERHAWAQSLPSALTTLHQFKIDLPNKLITSSAKIIAAQRLLEMEQFFSALDEETFDGRAL